MALPPLFWPWEFFNICMVNTPSLDLCLRWTIERHMWQVAILVLLAVGIGLAIYRLPVKT